MFRFALRLFSVLCCLNCSFYLKCVRGRSGQIYSLAMGSIPVLVDWQAEAVASIFNGILFQTQVWQHNDEVVVIVSQIRVFVQDRFEDIFVILDRKAAHFDPEYILKRLAGIVARGAAGSLVGHSSLAAHRVRDCRRAPPATAEDPATGRLHGTRS